ncbi:MAG: plastocyanin/azurin family copper-binding protein [Chthoniobacterales bacterium]
MKTFTNPERGILCLAVVMNLLVFTQTTNAKTVTVQVGGDAPVFAPGAVFIQPGDTVNWEWFSVGFNHSVTSGSNGHPDGLFNSGIHTDPFTFSFTFPNAGTFPYYCIPHLSMGMVGTVFVAEATPTPSPTPSQPLNISTRMEVRTEDQVLIGGFIITGNAPKEVILRAIGPSLAGSGIPNPLADPVLELHGADGSLITTNDNWKDTQQSEIEAAGFQPQDDLESAILSTLDPGSYTAIVSGKDGGTGVGLVEGYDLDEAADSQFANISTRGFVETDSNVMIGGFILGGSNGDANVLIRAVGPSLTQFGVADALADPSLELHDGNGALIQSNDNWKDTQQSEIEATKLQPQNDLESAIFATLAPAAYTAIVVGKGGLTGVALVEVYRLP